MSAILADLGMKIEIASWRNIVPNVWSLHIRDAHSPMCFTNGKGATKEGALASALGEFIERLNCNFFYNDQFWGEDIASAEFVHYPTSAGSSLAQKTNCRARFSTNTVLRFTTAMASCVARTSMTPTPATLSVASARCVCAPVR